MDRYPEWLGLDLISSTLPWEQGVPSSLSAFLDRFDLQGSSWIGLYAEPEQNATLLLRWDAHPAAGQEPAPEHAAMDWLLLAVRFDALERADVKLRDGVLANAVSGATSRAADWHRTQLEDHRGGSATLLHAPTVRLICLTWDRVPLALPVPAESL